MKAIKAASVDAYIAEFPVSTQQILKQVRRAVKKAAPDAMESISYAMPGYKLNGKVLVYFAGYDHHIGFYATPAGHEAFKKELSKYKQGKGSVQFPLGEEMPLSLIDKMVRYKAALIEKESTVKKTVKKKK